LKLAG